MILKFAIFSCVSEVLKTRQAVMTTWIQSCRIPLIFHSTPISVNLQKLYIMYSCFQLWLLFWYFNTVLIVFVFCVEFFLRVISSMCGLVVWPGSHRRRSNTAQRLEKLKRERHEKSQIRHVQWRAASQTGARQNCVRSHYTSRVQSLYPHVLWFIRWLFNA